MHFWEAQRKAKERTVLFVSVFIFLTLIMATVSEFALRFFAGPENYSPQVPWFGLLFLAITFLTAGFKYSSFALYGGSAVAEACGGKEIFEDTPDVKEKQLFNIVQEMAIASSIPTPHVYLLPCQQINAFAAGLKKENAAIAVTKGALSKLTRDELQGVIAHEFGHLHNGDMKVSTRLAAMVMGFFIIMYVGIRLLEGSFFVRGSGDRKGGSGQVIALAGLIFMIAGIITWFFGSILKSFISREREYLADASAVQYTRNPQGIAGALRKIMAEDVRDMPKSGIAYSHLYFDDRSIWNTLFDTHPPLEKRIKAILGQSILNTPSL